MIKVGVLGATGAVGQRFIQILSEHPWFEITELLASERSAGKKYRDATKWLIETALPEDLKTMEVKLARPESLKNSDIELLFSAIPANIAKKTEVEFAEAGFTVASNAAAHRMDADVPLVIPEVNRDHLALIEVQQRKRGWDGCIITNPNCSTIVMTMTLKPLMQFGIKHVRVATMQAISGAGYTGLPAMAIHDNVIPFIGGEEGKMETEPLKILGELDGDVVKPANFKISASCHRVPVIDGHTEAIWVEFTSDPSVSEIKKAFYDFRREIESPTSPEMPIMVMEEEDRPQPRLDRDLGRGMTVSVGRIRADSMGLKYIAMGHNTIRGAVGASVLNAEVFAVERGIVK
ncbi:MAG: aspartate-semialdehyde dehydrogenase [Candidatus Syntrophoarchaeum caldarius]|uniref:Aspartate-semialdehyde dehydrogenase n=1 Tax=Candidatus Syntropharchaeum caldarium TaxID=1838285 RepID=A0A1F2P9M6_9EURY|nr:MAG: aspartate-semialdehyde dehydrogenase [Candidatus Syntrophoarchaeum caldarius]